MRRKHHTLTYDQERAALRNTTAAPRERTYSADALAAQQYIDDMMAKRLQERSLPAIVLAKFGLSKEG